MIRKLKLQQHDKRWLNDVMNEVHTSMNDTHLDKISKFVDKTNQFTIQSYWINDTISKIDIELPSKPITSINTPILHKIKLQILVQSDSGANCNLPNNLDLLSDVHAIPDSTLSKCNTSDTSNIISNKAGYMLCRDDPLPNKTTIGSMVGYNILATILKLVELFSLAAPAILILRFLLSAIMICGIMTLMN